MLNSIQYGSGAWHSPGMNVCLSELPPEQWGEIHEELPNFPIDEVSQSFVNTGALNIPAMAARMAQAEDFNHRVGVLCLYQFRKIGKRWLYMPESLAKVLALLAKRKWLNVESFERELNKDGRSQIASLRQMGFTILTRRQDKEQAKPHAMFNAEAVAGHMAQWCLVGDVVIGSDIKGEMLVGVPPISAELPGITEAEEVHLKRLAQRYETSKEGLRANLNKWSAVNFMNSPNFQLSLDATR